jgi:hypothetical protein
MKKIILVLILLSAGVQAQNADSLYHFQSVMEERLGSEEEEEDSYISQYIDELLQNPVNINTADLKEISLLPFLSSSDARKIVEHRETYGPFFSKAELYIIKDIPYSIIRDIMPFIILTDIKAAGIFSDYKISARSRFRKNDISDNKNGHLWSNYNRLNLSFSKKITAGFLTEKDEGEKSITDLLTAFIRINDIMLKSVTVGDYKFESGQGLLFWGSYGMPKNADVTNSVCKRSRGIIPNTGNSEMGFFRGIAFEQDIKGMTLRGFYSGIRRDASTDSVNIYRLIKDGYHRTATELSRRSNVYERTFGGSLAYSSDIFETSVTGYTADFSKVYQNRGKNLRGLALSSKFIIDDLLFFGEAAVTGKFSAMLAGFNINPVKNIEFTSVFRRYEPGYINLYGFGFGENNGATINETGVYSGISLRTDIGDFSCYLDQYTFLVPTDRNHNRHHGYDILFYASIPLNKKLTFNIRYKNENKDDLVLYESYYSTGSKLKQNFRVELNYKSNQFNLKTRGEYASFFIRDKIAEDGYLLMNEIKYNLIKEAAVIMRVSFFRTDSFRSGLYTYETGMPGIIENKVFYGEGLRFYTIVKIALKNFPVLYIKYSDTVKESINITQNSSVIIQMEINY